MSDKPKNNEKPIIVGSFDKIESFSPTNQFRWLKVPLPQSEALYVGESSVFIHKGNPVLQLHLQQLLQGDKGTQRWEYVPVVGMAIGDELPPESDD